MSTAYQTQAPTPTSLDASQSATLSDPFDNEQGTVYPSMYSYSGSSQSPSGFPPSSTHPTFPSRVSDVYGTGYINSFANYQDYGTVYPPTGFIPPMGDTGPSMNYANFQPPGSTFYDMSVGTSPYATALQASAYTGHQVQTSSTFQCESPSLPQAIFVDQQDQHGVYNQEYSAVEAPPPDTGDFQSVSCQSQEEFPAAVAEQEVRLSSDQ